MGVIFNIVQVNNKLYENENLLTAQLTETFTVQYKDCISEIDESLPSLLGTYTIVKWMEIVCAKNILSQLKDSQISVGEPISIEHSGMVECGEKIDITSSLEAQEGRKVTFSAEASYEGKVIAKAFHQRTIIPKKLIARMLKK